MRFNGGEGVDTDGTTVWFSTKGDNRIWAYSTTTQSVGLRYQAGRPSMLAGVDNLHLDRASGVLLVAEDGDDMQLVALFPDDSLQAVVQVLGHQGSEVTGPRFSPDGSRLYFSSQRGGAGPTGAPFGVTYEVSGPWDDVLGR
jgi:secreted PhoX family phosphatase